MNTEDRQDCGVLREELTRSVCGDAEPSRALSDHLAGCPACADEWAASQELVGRLRTALWATPLSSALAAQIRRDLDQRCGARRTRWIWPAGVAAGAAAAAVVALWLIPALRAEKLGKHAGAAGPEAMLTAQEIDVALVAWELTTWDAPLIRESAQYVADQLEDMERTVARDPAGARWLPWSTAEDWDLPEDAGGASRSHDCWS